MYEVCVVPVSAHHTEVARKGTTPPLAASPFPSHSSRSQLSLLQANSNTTTGKQQALLCGRYLVSPPQSQLKSHEGQGHPSRIS